MTRADGTAVSRSRTTLGLAALAAALVATTATLAFTGSDDDVGRVTAQSDDDPDSDRRTIRVNGQAEVEVTPDVATVTMGAEHTAPSAGEALDTVSAKTDAVIGILQQAGIDDGDIQTSSLSVRPQHGGDRDQITGYQASNTVTVETTDLAGLGGLIDRVAKEAADQFRLDGVSFSFQDPDAVLAETRAEAVADARTKAGQFVAGEDVQIGEIRSIVEAGGGRPPVPMYAADEARAAQASVPVEPGSQELTIDVTVVFELS